MAESIKTARERKAADTRIDTHHNEWEKLYPKFPLSYHPASGRLYKKNRETESISVMTGLDITVNFVG